MKRRPHNNRKPAPRRPDARVYLICALLAASVLAVYWPAGDHPFTMYDDNVYVTKNPQVLSGLCLDSIRWAFTSSHGSNWHPLTSISLMADVQIVKWLAPTNPAAVFHWTSILLHAANTVILFLLLASATSFLWRSAFVAALFAFHPMHVESVAWIAERKDVLSTLFWLLTTWAYVKWTRKPRARTYAAAILCLALGLMSKPMLVTLPFTLLLLDFWPLNRLPDSPTRRLPDSPTRRLPDSPTRRLVIEKLPMFALVAGSCVLTMWAQKAGGSLVTLSSFPIGLRVAAAIAAYPSYIIKMIFPVRLAVFYPYPGFSISGWQVIAGGIFILAATLGALRFAARKRYIPVGWFWFVITLVPVIGLVQVGMQFIADRYTYIPSIGLFVLIAWAIPELSERWVKSTALLVWPALCVIAAMLALTWAQIGYWRDDTTLFGHAVAVTQNNYLAESLLGGALAAKGDPEGAIQHYQRSIAINPSFGDARYNLGNTLNQFGRTAEAVVQYREALKIYPERSEVYNNLACALNALGQTSEAELRFSQAIDKDPNNFEAHYNLAGVLVRRGRIDEAIEHLQIANRLRPNDPHVQANLQHALELKPPR